MSDDRMVHEKRLRNAVDQIAQVQEFDIFDAPQVLEDLIADAHRLIEHASALQEISVRG